NRRVAAAPERRLSFPGGLRPLRPPRPCTGSRRTVRLAGRSPSVPPGSLRGSPDPRQVPARCRSPPRAGALRRRVPLLAVRWALAAPGGRLRPQLALLAVRRAAVTHATARNDRRNRVAAIARSRPSERWVSLGAPDENEGAVVTGAHGLLHRGD